MRFVIAATLVLLAACKKPEPPAPAAPPADPVRGKLLIEQFNCTACHVIPGVEGSRGMIGPALDHVASKPTIAEKHQNNPQTMAKWIQNPQSFDPANTMPALGINDADARDIAAYLFTLK